jgi:hypothetical protein
MSDSLDSQKSALAEQRTAIRKVLGIPDGLKVAFVIFESGTEFEFRAIVPTLMSNYHKLIVMPLGPIASRQLNLTLATALQEIDALVVDGLDVHLAADELVMIRYHEELAKASRITVRVVDLMGRWLAKDLAG